MLIRVKSPLSILKGCIESVHVHNIELGSLRPVPTRPICRRPTAIVGQFPSADSRELKILNMFDRGSRPTITESVI